MRMRRCGRPNSKHIVFAVDANDYSLYWIRSDVTGDPQRILENPNFVRPWSFSPDGRRLAYIGRGPETGFDLWVLPLDITDAGHPKPGKPEPFLRTLAYEMVPQFSPDGRWIAYRSNESGSFEIYVRPYPAGSGVRWWRISNGGGLYAFWANNGRELFYETADNRIMAMDYTVDGASFLAGKPRLWSDKQLFYTGTSTVDLAPDGKRFAVLRQPQAPAGGEKGTVHVIVLLNFFDEVRRRIP